MNPNPVGVTRYRSYTNPSSPSTSPKGVKPRKPKPRKSKTRKSKPQKSKPRVTEKLTSTTSLPPKNRRTTAAKTIQTKFRMRKTKSPPTTRPTVQTMIDDILSMTDLHKLRLSQANRAMGPRNSPRTKYHLGSTGSW